MHNFEFIDRNRRHAGPFEITQLINSFLALVAHPWDQLLDQKKLKEVGIGSRQFKECGFPDFPGLPVEEDSAKVEDAYELLRALRNSMAHGNMDLLDRKSLRRLRQSGPLPRVAESEIAGLKLGNRRPENGPITWCTALNIHELHQILRSMMRLCEKRSLWKDQVRILQDQRDAERKAMPA